MSEPRVTNALSFDIEDWFHLVEIEAVADPAKWPALPSLVERYTEQILRILQDARVRSTFFILGWVAERYPGLVRSIAAEGHELGSHSFWHRRVYELSAGVFADDLAQSIAAIKAAVPSAAVNGFRAPSFSIIPGSEWAFDVMRDAGITYDASLFPAPRGHGGYPCQMSAHLFRDAPSGRPMPELPMSVMRAGPLRLPFSGGGYLRALPPLVIRRGFDQLNRRGIPVVVYLHPRDFAADCPRVPMPLHRRFKSYVGLRHTADKLRMLLERYRFDSCASVLGDSGLPIPG